MLGRDPYDLELIFRRHWPAAHRAAYLVVHDSGAAEDIAQEAFLSAMRSMDRFDRRRPFGPWLHRIVVNRAIDHARSRKLRQEVDAERVPELAVGGQRAGARALGRGDRRARVASPETRAIVVMRHLLEYTPGEIAEMLDMPRGTVNSKLRRALDRLGEELER